MKLNGKLVKGTVILKDISVERYDEDITYTELLTKCLVDVCKKLDIPVPLWLEKNTKEFVRYRRTFFPPDQFLEEVYFDKFEIRLEE